MTMWERLEKEKRGGGVGILISQTQKYRDRDDLLPPNPQFELKIVELKANNESVLVVSLYRPPNQNIDEWLTDLKLLLENLQTTGQNIIIGLDHNLDLLKSHTHKKTQEFLELLTDNGLFSCVTKPTRITHQSATLIDNVLVSWKLYSEHMCHLITEDINDHLPCIVSLPSLTSLDKDPFLITKRHLNDKIVNQIVEDLSLQIWKLDQSDVNLAFNELHDKILNIVDKNAPEKTFRKRLKKHAEPWITKGIQNSIRKQRKLYYELNKVNVATCKHERCKTYKSCLQKLIRKSKRNYFSQQCIDYKANTKKLWNVINTVIRKTPHKHVIEKLKIKGLLTANGTEIANELGTYFAQVSKTFTDKLPA